jgi:hypothetical protein
MGPGSEAGAMHALLRAQPDFLSRFNKTGLTGKSPKSLSSPFAENIPLGV